MSHFVCSFLWTARKARKDGIESEISRSKDPMWVNGVIAETPSPQPLKLVGLANQIKCTVSIYFIFSKIKNKNNGFEKYLKKFIISNLNFFQIILKNIR